tara:strand:- start:67 stop:1302 length:1236 start_codon:yes stop_codon:yes gene_type:complete
MGKVRERKETGKLYLDFMFEGLRCREQTALPDTPANRKKCEALLQKVEAKILLGEFDYAEFFPGSKNLKKLAKAGALSGSSRASNVMADPDQETDQSPLFPDFADLWLQENKIQWRASHLRNVESILESSLKPAFKNKRLTEITKSHILAARNKLGARKGRGGNAQMAPKSINSHMAILRMILTEGAERYDFANPYRNIKPLKLKKVQIEPFSMDEVDKITKYVREDYRNYYQVRFFTGMRTGEIDGLKWEHVDFEKREILVRETLINGKTEYTKTDGSQREIPMFGPVYDALKAQHASTGKLSKFVFCNRLGEPLDHNNVTKRVWYPLLQALNLKKRRPYQTRHTAATLLLASGENPEWVARVLGHSSTEMLFKVYSRFIPNVTRMDGSAFERLIQSRVTANQEVDNETE